MLEAVAAAKAVVATPRALEGIDVRHGEHVVVAERDDDIAEAVSRLLNDEQEHRALGSRAHEWARRGLSWSSMAERYAQRYEELRRPQGMGQ
ncbi:MAG: glycosyltransferase [Chloroflexota bacterium]|nr:glycosyltransferase [Chloroflexota bacterium]